MSSKQSSSPVCPFCDSAQSYRYIAEGELMRAIYSKAPACAYHVLIVPKQHIQHVDGLSTPQFSEALNLIKRLNSAAKKQLGDDYLGYNILSNNGEPEVNQHVQHAHIHLFLRTKFDSVDPITNRADGTPGELSEAELKNMKRLQSWLK